MMHRMSKLLTLVGESQTCAHMDLDVVPVSPSSRSIEYDEGRRTIEDVVWLTELRRTRSCLRRVRRDFLLLR